MRIHHRSERPAARAPVTWSQIGRQLFAGWAVVALACARAQGRALGDPVATAWPPDAMAPGPLPPAPGPTGAQALANFPGARADAPPPWAAPLWDDARLAALHDLAEPRTLEIGEHAPDVSAIARFIGSTGAVPRLARDVNEKILFVYGSSTDAATTQLGSSNPEVREDAVTPLSLSTLARWTPRLATQAGAAGLVLRCKVPSRDGTYGAYAYWGSYRDAARNVTSTVMTDSAHAPAVFDTTALTDIFGDHAYAQIWAAAAGEGALPAPPSLSADGQSLDVTTASRAELADYLRQRTAPALAFSRAGRPYFVTAAGEGRVNVTDLLAAGPYVPVALDAFQKTFNFLDSARQGNGTLLFADQAAGNITAGAIVRLREVRSVAGNVVLEVGVSDLAANLTLGEFQQTFGEAGMLALQAGVSSDPAVPAAARGVTYAPTPANATLWPRHPGPDMVSQLGLRDSFFLGPLAAQLHANPAYAYDLIRPSADGNPWHSDARFFDPMGFYFRPFGVTVRNALPTRNGVAVSATYREGATDCIAVPLLETAFAAANEQLHMHSQGFGLDALGQGDPGLAMWMMTGNEPRVRPTYFFDRDAFASLLGAANDGTLVLLQTPASNGPGPWSQQVPGLVEKQTYVVLNTTRDAQRNESQVHLFTPLRAYAPDGQGGQSTTSNGSFTLALDDVRRGFATIFYGAAGQ